MNVRMAVAVLVGFMTAGVSRVEVQAPDEAATRSVSDGVYTVKQAKRGEEVYAQACMRCHGPSLEGSQNWAPPLSGTSFLDRWAGTTVGDLLEWIHATMPGDRMEPLGLQHSVDVTAFILKANKFPAGGTELPSDLTLLKQIALPPKE